MPGLYLGMAGMSYLSLHDQACCLYHGMAGPVTFYLCMSGHVVFTFAWEGMSPFPWHGLEGHVNCTLALLGMLP